MKITKQQNNYLLSNSKGEYHISIEEFEKLGEAEAIKLAESEIEKKLTSSFTDAEIDFDKARSLGFCEYGIKDFCEMLQLNVDESHKLSDVKSKLTVKAFIKYPQECFKLFGKEVFSVFGGVSKFLGENRTQKVLNLVLISNIIPDRELHKLACTFAYRVLPNFEKEFPNDDRPRKAIEAKLAWIDGNCTDEELSAAYSAARSAAARSAAYSAVWSAYSAAVDSAAVDSAELVEVNRQIDEVLKVIGDIK